MSISCREIVEYMEELAPARLAEDWDNVGLLLGNKDQEIHKILVCLDVTGEVIEEAVNKKADLIISHHPFIFKGMKRIVENDFKGECIYKLIRNGIGVYSAHTNLDFAEQGLTGYLSGILGLKDVKNLRDYRPEKLFKVAVFVPEDSTEKVRESMTGAGAGWIGKYSDCSFIVKGTGTFRPLEGTNPYIGSEGELEEVDEYRIETIVPADKLKIVLKAMLDAHPYEEAAYDVYPLEISMNKYGYGKVGMLEGPRKLKDFIEDIKKVLNVSNVRVIGYKDKMVKKIAVFNGSYDNGILRDIQDEIDVLVTGDVKYHDARDMIDNGMCVIDAGHFGTENVVVKLLLEKLKSRFKDVEIIGNCVEKDPFEIY